MYELKPLSRDAIPGALAKAERYRLLNEPWQAESICRDILAIEPEHQAALVMLVLALTDLFDEGINPQEAHRSADRLCDSYASAYYRGIVFERHAIAQHRHGDFRSGPAVYALIESAMRWYERAQALRAPGNDDSVLRWNSCARFLQRSPHLIPAAEVPEPVLSE
jgi:TPR repeat protein